MTSQVQNHYKTYSDCYVFDVVFNSAHYDFKDLSLKTVNDKNKNATLTKYKISLVSRTPRDTLSQTSLNIVAEVKEPLYIDVFLEGNFPGEFKKLQTETQQLLDEFKSQNSNIIFQFVNPLENEKEKDSIMQTFMQRGLTPVNVTVNDKGQQTQEVVFPWAVATCGNRSVKVPLLKNIVKISESLHILATIGLDAIKHIENKISVQKSWYESNAQVVDFIRKQQTENMANGNSQNDARCELAIIEDIFFLLMTFWNEERCT